MTSPSPEIIVRLPRLHAGQLRRRERIAQTSVRFAVTMCGRRWGKSTDGIEWLMDGALSGLSCGLVAPTFKYLGDLWREIVGRLRPLANVGAKFSEQDKRIELPNGGIIECWSADTPNPGRGRKYHRLMVDEAGIIRGLMDMWQQSLRPTLVDYKGSAWFYGTPKGRTHDFVVLFAKGDSGDPDWMSFRAPTRENPYIPPEEIEAARRDMPEGAFLQEFEGIPADDGANPFGLSAIAACVGPLSRKPPIVWGWDFARAQDWTVGIGIDEDGKVCKFERWQGVPWGETENRVVFATGRQIIAYGDSTGLGDVVVEGVQRAGVRMQGVHFSRPEKQRLMERLVSAIQRQRITFPDGPIRQELDTFEYQYTAFGVRYEAPQGLHDDCVMALALAVQGLPEPMPMPERPDIPVKRDDRAVRWDHGKKQPIEVSPEEAFQREMGLGGPQHRNGEWSPGDPNW